MANADAILGHNQTLTDSTSYGMKVEPVVMSETTGKIDEEAVLVTNSSNLDSTLLNKPSTTSCVFIENN
jgi:hypothetical protein